MSSLVTNQQPRQNQSFSDAGESADGVNPRSSATTAEQLREQPTELEIAVSTPTPLERSLSTPTSQDQDGLHSSDLPAKDMNLVNRLTFSPENQILIDYRPTGASSETAAQLPNNGTDKPDQITGVAASEALVKEDMGRLNEHREVIEQVAKEKNIPPALLAAIISRETRAGNTLDSVGWGDEGNAFGVMQVDKRVHDISEGTQNQIYCSGTAGCIWDPWSKEHLSQGADILLGNLAHIQSPERGKGHHPDWPIERQWQGAVAAYNFGPGNVQNIDEIDKGTTGNDYSNDVWARAKVIAREWAPEPSSADNSDPICVPNPFGNGDEGCVIIL